MKSSVLAKGAHVLFGAIAALMLFAASPPAHAQSIIRDAEIEDTLRVYATPILRAAGLNPDDVQITIVNDPSLNAFVTGGQHIFIHTGLILAAQNPNEIIGVMAHETGHIADGHVAGSSTTIQRSMRVSMLSIGLGVLAIAAGAPDAGMALISGSQAFAMGNYVRHSQRDESAADQAAITYLDASGQSSRGLIEFFNRELRPYEYLTRRAPPYLITHPFTSDRVSVLRARAQQSAAYNNTDTPDNLHRFRFMQAKLVGFLQSQGQTLARYPESDVSQPARYARAIAYYRVSDLTRSRSELNGLIAEDPNNPYFQEMMGQLLFEYGRAAEALPYNRRAVQLAPHEALLEIALARALIAANGREGADDAIPLLQSAIDHDRDNGFAWRELAAAREARGERALAELASAELNYTIGNYPAAINFAERARRALPPNTPSFQRANDIINISADEAHDQAQNRRRPGG